MASGFRRGGITFLLVYNKTYIYSASVGTYAGVFTFVMY